MSLGVVDRQPLVVSVRWDRTLEPSELHIVTRGFPNQAMERAHQVASAVLGDDRWHFTEIVCIPPEKMGDNLDSHWRVECRATYKPNPHDHTYSLSSVDFPGGRDS